MTVRRSQWSTLTAGLFCGLLVYLVIISRLEGGSYQFVRTAPSAFNSRMLMNLQDSLSIRESISNSGVISAIDSMVQQISSGDLTDAKVKSISQEIGKQIADYVVQKLSQQTAISTTSSSSAAISCHSCWRYQNVTDLPIIYVVTPTYRRPEQIPELTRMAQTLLNVPAIHWIVVEDSNSTKTSPVIAALLNRYGIPHTHLKAQMPDKYKKSKFKPRGVANRNAALGWLRNNAKSGVLYFADDDNTYDIRLFEEMRFTKKVSMWPVGLVTKVGLSSPVVKNGVVVDFYDGWIANRKFPVDMAGFAVSIKLLLEKSDAYMPYVPGHEEDGFLKKLDITAADIEAKADQCSKILVWHTQTKSNSPANRTVATSGRYRGTNIERLQDFLV